jgi:uncharacterized membrane protein YfcA
MITIVVYTLIRRKPSNGQIENSNTGSSLGRKSYWIGMLLTFLLAIYGGLFSGGYVTVLTASFVAFFAMSYSESIAATKVINVFSSAVATLVFMYQGLVDYRLGIILGLTMFVAAYIGAHFATKMNELWLRRIFLSAVILLAVKTAIDLLI